MDYSKLSDFEINRSVAIAIGFNPDDCDIAKRGSPSVGVEWNEDTGYPTMVFDYCNNPADAWTIIVESGISINHYNGVWEASFEWDAPVGAFGTDETVTTSTEHKNPLRAAMVAYLMMREVNNVQTDSTR